MQVKLNLRVLIQRAAFVSGSLPKVGFRLDETEWPRSYGLEVSGSCCPHWFMNYFSLFPINHKMKMCSFSSLTSIHTSFISFSLVHLKCTRKSCLKIHFHPDSSHPVAAAANSLQLCLTLCDPIDGSPPGSTVPGIFQARVLEWVAILHTLTPMHL